MRRTLACLSFVALALSPALARATVNEPNGTAVPLDSMNGEIQLYTFFSSRGEGINWQADGATMPAVFSPLCDFRATFVLNQAGSHFGVGWYNADATSPPPLSDIHVIVPAGAPVGTVVTSMTIRGDPAYHGGLVGFALVGGQTHYSEQRWNVTCTSCTPPAPWILAVIYRSTLTPNAYYVAFEDGSVDSSSFNNDGDFNDDVFFFEGLSCMGGGQPCDTGMMGICAAGLTECTATGTSCHAEVTPRMETCNGLDDDCNGMVDDGMGLCPTGQVCDRGVCVPTCVEGSCFTGEVCTLRGTCVEADCATVTCPSGQICTGGMCHGACDGVVCPGDQACRAGRCVDLCAGVTCPMGHVCSGGVCVTSCTCLPCGSGTACDSTSGLCVDPACVGLTCASPQVCRSGSCVDPCTGAVCPAGETCSMGMCVPAPPSPDAGVMDSGVRDGGSRGDAAGDGRARDGSSGVTSTGGCGCRAAGAAPRGFAAIAGFLALMAARRRRRTRCVRPR